MTPRTLELAVAITLAAVASLALVAPAHASCIDRSFDQQLADADVVFVGVVRGLGNQDRTATFEVIEQWSGPTVAQSVVVHGGQDQPRTWSSADRQYEAGARYLVAAIRSGDQLRDNSCSATQVWSAELARYRPADARTVDAGPNPEDGVSRELVVGAGALVVLLVAGIFVFARVGGRGAGADG